MSNDPAKASPAPEDERKALFDQLRPTPLEESASHRSWRQRVRGFVEQEIAPWVNSWEREGTFPDGLYQRAIAHGVFGAGFPEALEGTGEMLDIQHRIILAEEMHRLGSGLVFADLATHWVALPAVLAHGAPALQEQVARPVLRGEKKICFAITEPSGGSDVANMQTRAEKHADGYSLTGSKTLISAALRADYALVLARTGAEGMRGLSLFLVELAQPAIARQGLPALHWYNRNVGTLTFNGAAVPENHRLGPENKGFGVLAALLETERFSGIGAMLGLSRFCLTEATLHCRERIAFGKRLSEHQSLKHELVAMHRKLRASYCFLDHCAARALRGETLDADLALLKSEATETLERCASSAMQLLAGRAYQDELRIERAYREARIFALAGGTREVLAEMAARQLPL